MAEVVGGVFLCYRRDDSRGSAGRLYGDLRSKLDPNPIFRDLDAIEAGADFAVEISKTVEQCDAFIALIGTGWIVATDAHGGRRLDNPRDMVRLEIAAALAAGTTVIPVLVEDAAMPAEEDLPEPLRPLAARNALPISDLRWDYDVQRLVSRLQRLLARKAGQDGVPGLPRTSPAPPAAPASLPPPAPAASVAAPAPLRGLRTRFAPVTGAFVAGIVVVLLVLAKLGTFGTNDQRAASQPGSAPASLATVSPTTAGTATTPTARPPVKPAEGSDVKITKNDGSTLTVRLDTLILRFCGHSGIDLVSGQSVPFTNMLSMTIKHGGRSPIGTITLISGQQVEEVLKCTDSDSFFEGENPVGSINVKFTDVKELDFRQ